MSDDFVLGSEKYKIVRELGRGGMGVVYLAEDVLLKRTVAVKVLYEHLNRDSAFVDRFQKEARSVSSLHHPNVVFVHGLELVRNTFLIDMEFVDGLSLDKFSRSAMIPPPVAVRIASDILEGLVTCHGAGVIHRDIKPANILLNQAGMAKIADFGLATAYAGHLMDSVKSQASSGFFMGTPRYAPPAAWDGQEPVPGWDLYSLGVMLFEMLSGQVAYPGETPMAIMRQHLTQPLQPLSEVAPMTSAALTELVDSLVASNGNDTALTAVEALNALRGTPEFEAVREGETARTIRMALRQTHIKRNLRPLRKWAIHGLYATALLFAGGAAFWLAQPDSQSPPAQTRPTESLPQVGDTRVFLRPEVVGTAPADDTLWMMTAEAEGGPAQVVSVSARGVAHLTLTAAGEYDRYAVTGGWGEYLAPTTGSIRYGTLQGEALMDREGNSISFSLQRTNSRDQSVTSEFLLAKPLAHTYNEAGFLAQLEANQAVQSLIYNELLPRNLGWVKEIESLQPGFPGGRLTVPRADTAINVDGRLSEPVWNQAFETGPRETLQAGMDGAPMRARWSDSALILGFAAQSVPPDAVLTLVIQPAIETATGASRQFHVVMAQSTIREARAMLGTQALPWRCDWEAAASLRGDRWEMEVRIPLSSTGALDAPGPFRRWRLNAHLHAAEGSPLHAHWGSEKREAVEHGLLLVFDEGTP